MPIYEYFCPKCLERKEILQRRNDPVPLCCCDEGFPTEMVKQFPSRTSFQLKGGGWFRDGYSKKKNK
jgi:putative FmdB family regulatory protein